MTRHTDPQKIAEMLEAERAALGRTLDSLSSRFSSAARKGQGLAADASPYVEMAQRTLRDHPVAVAMAGAGLVWLLFGVSKGSTPAVKPAALQRWEDEGGQILPAHPDDPDPHQTWRERAEHLRARATQAITRIEEDASAHAADLQSGLFSRASALRDFASEKAAVVADLAEGLAHSMQLGLEGLSDDAQARVVAAREAAYARLTDLRAHPVSGSRRLVEDHPLIVGAVALALGAAVAASLPRAKGETGFAAERDRLLADALRLMDEKRRSAQKMAVAAGDILTEAAKDSAASLTEKARATAEKLKDEVAAGLKTAKG